MRHRSRIHPVAGSGLRLYFVAYRSWSGRSTEEHSDLRTPFGVIGIRAGVAAVRLAARPGAMFDFRVGNGFAGSGAHTIIDGRDALSARSVRERGIYVRS